MTCEPILASRTVVPSGVARATVSEPMAPPAPPTETRRRIATSLDVSLCFSPLQKPVRRPNIAAPSHPRHAFTAAARIAERTGTPDVYHAPARGGFLVLGD